MRIPYDEATIQSYLRDKRYKDLTAREAHLRKGKFATNILRVPSLKGASSEKASHPSQKPEALINHLVASSTRPGDAALGSSTTAVYCEEQGRQWTGIEKNANYASIARQRLEAVERHTLIEQTLLTDRAEPETSFHEALFRHSV